MSGCGSDPAQSKLNAAAGDASSPQAIQQGDRNAAPTAAAQFNAAPSTQVAVQADEKSKNSAQAIYAKGAASPPAPLTPGMTAKPAATAVAAVAEAVPQPKAQSDSKRAVAPPSEPRGSISQILSAQLILHDDNFRPISNVAKSEIAMPASGLPFYGRKGMFFQIMNGGQLVWVKESQVKIGDDRPLPIKQPSSRDPDSGTKSVSPGLD